MNINNLIKQCSKCKEVKSVNLFSKNSGNKGGLHGHCKECVSIYQQKTNLIIPKGYNSHHWNYNYGIDTILLTIQRHTEIHKRLIYDQESFCFETLDGQLLDTKRKHLEFVYATS